MSDLQIIEGVFDQRFACVCEIIQRRMERFVKIYGLLHALFISILLLLALAICMTLLLGSPRGLLAMWLAITFCVSFFFFVLRIYYQSRLPEQLGALRDEFIASSRQILNYRDGVAAHHLTLAEMLSKMAMEVKDAEYELWTVAPIFRPLQDHVQWISSCWHWKDIHIFRQMLLLASIDEYIKLVQCDPVNIEVHAALANGYVLLSSLYNDPKKKSASDFFSEKSQGRPPPFNKNYKVFEEKFRVTAERAIEEFKIISYFAPDDPWVHAQLAYSYCDLQMPNEEIQEYEHLLELCPEDDESRFRLGVLYFQQGRNADGLRVYQELISQAYPKAHQLLSFYDAYRASQRLDPFEEA